MKRCRRCNSVYSGDDLSYCLIDGTRLSYVPRSDETLIMSNAVVSSSNSGRSQLGLDAKWGYRSLRFYGAISRTVLVVAGIVFWFSARNNFFASKYNVASSPTSTNASQDPREQQKKVEALENWIFATDASDGRIKVYYLWLGRTFKLRFVNNDETAQIKYKVRGQEKIKGEWVATETPELNVVVKKGQPQFDNIPVPSEVEEIRDIEIEIIDWNYK
jgi:hypothetical protein